MTGVPVGRKPVQARAIARVESILTEAGAIIAAEGMRLAQFPHIFRGELGVSVRFAFRAAMSLEWPATPPPVVMHCTKATSSIFAIAALDRTASGQPFGLPILSRATGSGGAGRKPNAQ